MSGSCENFQDYRLDQEHKCLDCQDCQDFRIEFLHRIGIRTPNPSWSSFPSFLPFFPSPSRFLHCCHVPSPNSHWAAMSITKYLYCRAEFSGRAMDTVIHCSSTEFCPAVHIFCYTHCSPVVSANTAIQRARRALQVAEGHQPSAGARSRHP